MAIEMKTLTEGDLLHNRYRIEEVLGRGGFGITYKAVDTTMMLSVAVKQYISTKKRDIEHAINEARISAQFYDLEGVSTARDFFIEDGYAYIIMSYVKGISLRKYVEQFGHFEGSEVLERFRGMLDSLAIIHEKGYIHRDITPDNILISSEGKLTLIDFGASRFTKEEAEGNHTVVFKRGFAPIEQCRTNGVQGTFTDIYAICATMYFMMTGIVPDDAVDRVMGDKLKSLDMIYGTGLTESTKRAIMDGLSVEPEERIRTVAELKARLYESDEGKALKPKEKLFLTEEMKSNRESEERRLASSKEGKNEDTAAVYRSIERFVEKNGNSESDNSKVIGDEGNGDFGSKNSVVIGEEGNGNFGSENSKVIADEEIDSAKKSAKDNNTDKKRIVRIISACASVIAIVIIVGFSYIFFARDRIGLATTDNNEVYANGPAQDGSDSSYVSEDSSKDSEAEVSKNGEKSKKNNNNITYNGRKKENTSSSNADSEVTADEGEAASDDSKETSGNGEDSSDNVNSNKKDKVKSSTNSGNTNSTANKSNSGNSNSTANKSNSGNNNSKSSNSNSVNNNSKSNKSNSGNKTEKTGASGNSKGESGNKKNNKNSNKEESNSDSENGNSGNNTSSGNGNNNENGNDSTGESAIDGDLDDLF